MVECVLIFEFVLIDPEAVARRQDISLESRTRNRKGHKCFASGSAGQATKLEITFVHAVDGQVLV